MLNFVILCWQTLGVHGKINTLKKQNIFWKEKIIMYEILRAIIMHYEPQSKDEFEVLDKIYEGLL